MTRVAVFNSKGGVGKTTSVLNLAAAAARAGYRNLLLDLDPQAHLTRILCEPPRDSVNSLYGFFQDARSLTALEIPWDGIGTLIPAHGQLIKVIRCLARGQRSSTSCVAASMRWKRVCLARIG